VTNKIELLYPRVRRRPADDRERLERALAEVPIVDAARVAQGRAALANGTYRIDATAIAMRLLRFEWDLRG
jgi:flagellar biosynthesis anti-sigma factor FlgM